ncbi:MAG TPA: VOC family protein [Blastocatellia bacterium]|nr:VOC family protein [Blastocatellia bacterium]
MTTLNSAAPTFVVSDIGATMRWYEKHLGFEGDPFPAAEPFVFAILRRDTVEIMLMRIEGYQKPDLSAMRPAGLWDTYVRTSGLAELYESLRESVTVIKPLSTQPYGLSEFWIKDPNGYILAFSE